MRTIVIPNTNRVAVTSALMVRSSQASAQAAPQLQAGISVETPVTKNATLAPEADQPDALIVTVRDDGRVYLGGTATEVDAVTADLHEILSKRTAKTVFIKADARAAYATVMSVLDAATAAGSETTVLLTSQYGSPQPGRLVPPTGFSVLTGECKAAARSRLSL